MGGKARATKQLGVRRVGHPIRRGLTINCAEGNRTIRGNRVQIVVNGSKMTFFVQTVGAPRTTFFSDTEGVVNFHDGTVKILN
jgi:hypothetical protein